MEKQEATNPNLEYLLVLDFEATCIQDKKLEPCSEIIEFPIVVVHLESAKTLDVFHHYVKPTYHPQLSKFCTELTGITQQQVDKGLTLSNTLQELDKWISKLHYLKQDNFAFVTCGDWDLRTCLRQQAKHKRLYIKQYLRNYINIKKYYAKIIGNQGSQGMMTMLKGLGIPHEGRHHSGIDDVTNICHICIELHHKYKAPFPKTEINRVAFHLSAENIAPQINYLLVLDFQATCLQNQKIEPCPEIIEMPVAVIDTHAAKELDSFHCYVRPTLNPKLSAFCTELTGIAQQQVDNKGTIQEVLADFDKWLQSLPYLKDNNFVFVTCGDWDICTCLRQQSKTKHFKLQKYFEKYINLKAYFPKLVKTKGKVTGMMDMIKHLDLKHEGKHHSGKDDVKNIVNVCLELLKKHDAKFSRQEVRHIEL